MAEIIKKIANAGKIYSIGGGSTPVEEVEHKVVTQEEFDVIPQEEKVKNVYMIKGEAEPTPTPGGGTMIERGDMILDKVNTICGDEGYYIYIDGVNVKHLKTNIGIDVESTTGYYGYFGGKFINLYHNNSSGYIGIYNLKTGEKKIINECPAVIGFRINSNGIFIKDGYEKCHKADFDLTGITQITLEEYNNEKDYSNSINGLFYSQNGDDYVAKDIDGNVVKTYENVGTITGIANGKLYRAVNGVSYAICGL